MVRRSVDWNEGLAKDLQDLNFAREFLLASLTEGISIQVALGKVIRAMGVKGFSKKSKIASSNIVRAINPKHNPSQDTLNRLLKPFGLMLTVIPITRIVSCLRCIKIQGSFNGLNIIPKSRTLL